MIPYSLEKTLLGTERSTYMLYLAFGVSNHVDAVSVFRCVNYVAQLWEFYGASLLKLGEEGLSFSL